MNLPRRKLLPGRAITRFFLGLGAGGLTLVGFGRPGVRIDPPTCSDTSVVSHLKQAYGQALVLHHLRQKFQPDSIKETGFGPSPRSANQFAPSRDFYRLSRYCQATMHLTVGAPDTVYFRLDGRKDGLAADYNFDSCFPRYDTLEAGCVHQRPGGR